MARKMRAIYVAGKYSAPNVIQVGDNMRAGWQACYNLLVNHGFAPFNPWADFDYLMFGPVPLETFYAYSLAQLERQEAVFVLPMWEKSTGTKAEIRHASLIGIPVFFELEKLLEWRDRLDAEETERP